MVKGTPGYNYFLKTILLFCFVCLCYQVQAGFFSWLKTTATPEQKYTIIPSGSSTSMMPPADVCSSLPATSVGGNVWDDYNFNGARDEATITGVSGVTVNVYGCDGILLGTQVTDIDGDWSLDVSLAPTCDGCQEVRIEYVNLPVDVKPTESGIDNGSTVQFVNPGTCTGLGVLTPGPCPPPFDFSTALGDPFPLNGSIMGPGIAFVTCGILSSIPPDEQYVAGLMDLRNIPTGNNRPATVPPMYHHPSWRVDSIGNVFGLDYDTLGNMYLSASTQYGAGFGFAGDVAVIRYGEIGGGASDLNAAGTVYKLDRETGQASVFTVLPQLSHSFTQGSCEGPESLMRNTGVGLGNMVYNRKLHQFYISNFEDGKIYRVDGDGTILDSFDPFSPDDGSPGPAPDTLPYGLAISPEGTDLFFGTHALNTSPAVYSIGLTATGAFTGSEVFHATHIADGVLGGGFAYPSSWIAVSDLEFLPDGNLMVGMRTGCLTSYFTSHNHGGTFYIMDAADPDGLYNDLVNNPDIQYLNDGTGNDDGYGGIGIWDRHDGTWDYVLTSSDIQAEPGPHGLLVFPEDYTEDGDGTTEYTLRPSAAISYFGSLSVNDVKGVGGDASVYSDCTINVVEIGNKVWKDLNGDGIQDACEPGIAGMNVSLYDTEGNVIATTQTDSNGEYYFNRDSEPNQTWVTPNDRVRPDSAYLVVFGESQFAANTIALGGDILALTQDSSATGANAQAIDSDVEVAVGLTGGLAALNGLPLTSVHTDGGGYALHEIDLGLTLTYDWGDLPDLTVLTGTGDYQTDSSSNGPVHQIIDGLYFGSTVDNEVNGQESNDADGDGADEDGLVINAHMQVMPGGILNLPLLVTNTSSDTAHVEIWIDWNGDGDFDEPNEMVIDLSDENGATPFPTYISINIPTDAVQGQNLGLRMRLSNQDNMTPYGAVASGEVEDYLLTVDCPANVCLNINSNN